MNTERRLNGLALKIGPLGESDRLLTILSDEEGLTKLAVPGARKPKSRLAAAVPLTFLELQVGGKKGLSRVRHLKVIKSFNKVGERLESLAAAQAIAELVQLLVTEKDPIPGILSTVLVHLQRLNIESQSIEPKSEKVLANLVQSFVHLLALGGYALPVQECCRSRSLLRPPIGQWEWKCSFLPSEGFVVGDLKEGAIFLNPSELALLQRLLRPELPIRKDGELMGPKKVWLKLLSILELWIQSHLTRNIQSIRILRESL